MSSPSQLSMSFVDSTVIEICEKAARSANGVVFRSSRDHPSDSKRLFRFEGLNTAGGDVLCICTFYLAYSTWDGRMLYLDRMVFPSQSSSIDDGASDNAWACRSMIVLAQIAVALGCSRLTWRRFAEKTISLNNSLLSIEPTFLKGWLTVHWETNAMQKYLGSFEPECRSKTLEESLELLSASSGSSDFHLRLAGVSDVDDIMMLVQGLAEYEKEPDAVNTTAEILKTDGFSDNPLFYCILLDQHKGGKTCGMAFYYAAHSEQNHDFVYLDDLFIQENFRGKGGGTLLMKALATAALSTRAQRVIWQVLDWNAPAISFYRSIGASIQDGLNTYRYDGESLTGVAASPIE